MSKLIAIFLLWGVYVSAAQATDAPPKINLATTKTLFKIRVIQYVEGLSPKFYKFQDDSAKPFVYKAPEGTALIVVSKVDANYIVTPYDYKGQDDDVSVKEVKRKLISDDAACEAAKNVCTGLAYKVAATDIDQGFGLIRDSLVSGMFVAPFKYYPHTHTFSTTSLTVAPYFGWETDQPLWGIRDFGLVQKYTYFGAFGPTVVSVQSTQGNAATNVFALSLALGIGYDINQQIKFVLATGKDWTGSTSTPYKFNSLPWFAATLGYSF